MMVSARRARLVVSNDRGGQCEDKGKGGKSREEVGRARTTSMPPPTGRPSRDHPLSQRSETRRTAMQARRSSCDSARGYATSITQSQEKQAASHITTRNTENASPTKKCIQRAQDPLILLPLLIVSCSPPWSRPSAPSLTPAPLLPLLPHSHHPSPPRKPPNSDHHQRAAASRSP